MKYTFGTLILTILMLFTPTPGGTAAREQAGSRAGIAITEAGVDKDGNRLYTVMADSAEITELLKALFAKTNDGFSISQDVSGPVDLKVKAMTIPQILKQIEALTSPRIGIVFDKQGYHVSLAPEMDQTAQLNNSNMAQGAGRFGNNMAQRMNYNSLQAIPSDRYVSVDVDKSRPISLRDLIVKISAQTLYSIVLDKRIPRDVLFYGAMTHAPLPLALQTIADTAGLKLITDNSHAYLVPSDQFTLQVNNMILGRFPTTVCKGCGQTIYAGWNFCPNCGQPVGKPSGQNANQYRNNTQNRGQAGSRGQKITPQ